LKIFISPLSTSKLGIITECDFGEKFLQKVLVWQKVLFFKPRKRNFTKRKINLQKNKKEIVQ